MQSAMFGKSNPEYEHKHLCIGAVVYDRFSDLCGGKREGNLFHRSYLNIGQSPTIREIPTLDQKYSEAICLTAENWTKPGHDATKH